MKHLLLLLLVLFSLHSFSQTTDSLKMQVNKSSTRVSFITKFDITRATKDGFYLNEYVVNINNEQAKKLNGKKIKVSGKVTIVKGLKNLPGEPVSQGRAEDRKYINKPLIEVIVDYCFFNLIATPNE